MTKLTTPISEATIRSLKVGDEVQITGTLFTGRMAAGLQIIRIQL